ncbi:MAG: hypothetical protein JNK82_08630 [Myxococcaceae bacterium]|nr:hypothetical protein [Myxococcaceae bacterium]
MHRGAHSSSRVSLFALAVVLVSCAHRHDSARTKGGSTPGSELSDVLETSAPSLNLDRFSVLGITSFAALKAKLESPQTEAFDRLSMVQRLGDPVATRDAAAAMVARDPLDGASAHYLVEAEMVLGHDEAAVAASLRALSKLPQMTTEEARLHVIHYIVPVRCLLPWRKNDFKAALPLCLSVSKRTKASTGALTAARILANDGRFADALDQIAIARERNPTSGEIAFVAAVIHFAMNDTAAAERLLDEAVALWPNFTPALNCKQRRSCGVAEADQQTRQWWRRRNAGDILLASRKYRDLGMTETADERLDVAEALDPGAGRAERLARSASGSIAATEALAALQTTPHPHLYALAASGLMAERPDEARKLLLLGLELDAGDHVINRAWLQHAARVGDERAVAAAQLRTSRGFRATDSITTPLTQPSSARMNHQPPANIREVVLVPYLEGSAPELDGLRLALKERFVGIEFKMLEPRRLPRRWLARDGAQIDGNVVTQDEIEEGALVVALFDRDMFLNDWNYAYGAMDVRTHRGAVSVARFRTPEGEAAEPNEFPTGHDLARSRARFQGQVTSTLAKLIGLSFPCERREKCVLRFPRDMSEFDARGVDFCPKHQEELKTVLEK